MKYVAGREIIEKQEKSFCLLSLGSRIVRVVRLRLLRFCFC